MAGSLPSSARRRPVAASSARSAVTSWPAACSAPSMRSASCLLSSIMCRILAWGREEEEERGERAGAACAAAGRGGDGDGDGDRAGGRAGGCAGRRRGGEGAA